MAYLIIMTSCLAIVTNHEYFCHLLLYFHLTFGFLTQMGFHEIPQ